MPCDNLLAKKTQKEVAEILDDVQARINVERDPARKRRLEEYLDHLRMHAAEAKTDGDAPLPPPPNPFKKKTQQAVAQ